MGIRKYIPSLYPMTLLQSKKCQWKILTLISMIFVSSPPFSSAISHSYLQYLTLQQSNIAIGNPPFQDDFPTIKPPWLATFDDPGGHHFFSPKVRLKRRFVAAAATAVASSMVPLVCCNFSWKNGVSPQK